MHENAVEGQRDDLFNIQLYGMFYETIFTRETWVFITQLHIHTMRGNAHKCT